jgi:hypothetical protein
MIVNFVIFLECQGDYYIIAFSLDLPGNPETGG